MKELNKIYCVDCLEGLKDVPDNSIDLVITSPPYDNIEGSGYGKVKKDILFLKLYSDFIDKVLIEIYRVLKPTGQFFLNLKHSTIKGCLKSCHWIEFTEGFQQFQLKSYIIWKYSGSFDSTRKRLHLDYEIVYHLAKSDNILLNEEGKDPLTSVWYIPHFIKDRLHPVQMPEALAEKIILLSSKEGDIVLDVFAGSGTTTFVANKLNRKWIGFEINPLYAKIAEERSCDEGVLKK